MKIYLSGVSHSILKYQQTGIVQYYQKCDTTIGTQSSNFMTEMDVKVELYDQEMSSYNSVAENTASHPNLNQIELKAEKIIETRLSVERGQALPNLLVGSNCNVTFEALSNLVEQCLIQHNKNVFHCNVCNELFYDSERPQFMLLHTPKTVE
jgi:hypothetical protein